MQITKDNLRQKIIIFNNEYLIEESSSSRASKNNKSLIISSDNSYKEEENEMELNIILKNGENINFKFKLDENIYSRVDNFCQENNIDQNGQDLILQQIDSKIAELSKQKKENNDSNQEDNDNENINDNNNDIKNVNNNIKNIENDNDNDIVNNNINNTDDKNSYKQSINNEENNMENNNNSEEKKDIKLKNKNKKKIIVRKRKLNDYEIGQRLYEKGKKFKVKKQRNIEKSKTETPKNSPRYDFKPKLYNQNLKSTKNRNMKIEDRLINLGKVRAQKILRKITEQKLYEENKNNDLSLTKGKNRKKYITRNKSADIFNKLYNDKDILKKKAEKKEKIYFKKVFPFKPKITDMAK